ncbi:ATP synthase F1, gamma subunit [Oleidesulfovibrio alaskensis G20]|jgi:F-type H+-transporting ATPase subunit gamma|uniref:ATP synthase gamma chain n=1 Tax=Oleidesulfovibrio alaskensis (strain ATCC BAA-1058 / DSM 17464 / G20) TaxID=207559 RepID=Q313V9_OLEA2|nr:F0F1 ATP synthase subunit gamma [Oleidesulfovibrio alaskensis]ABB37787.1 ATP synthase F1, gamma subunit [Oleidesulfovibrio alaskensis G20]MBG0773747.1 F0F1 ATP synthase subunit gamma [Oleidesulfovibrio alaskensis]MBL3582401.1 F0F1 ATP synthase subunit gamma [Oleidesulfovibrio alaskensis]
MPSLKDVQLKIAGVKKTKQITKAMNMVASAKLRGAQTRIERFRPYAAKFYEMLGDLASQADSSAHPLLEKREEVNTCGIILATSDRGLCGSFNVNLINDALRLAREKASAGKTVKFYCVGKKARDAVRKSEFEIVKELVGQMNAFDFTMANSIGLDVIHAYLTGELDEVVMIYGEFQSMVRQVPQRLQLLPMAAAKEEEVAAPSKEYTYEPAVEGLLAELLPRFIKVQIYRGLLDTSASEHAARMTAMDNATRSCDDMISSLTLLYNKTRQAAITRDLMDIVGGAEALKG